MRYEVVIYGENMNREMSYDVEPSELQSVMEELDSEVKEGIIKGYEIAYV